MKALSLCVKEFIWCDCLLFGNYFKWFALLTIRLFNMFAGVSNIFKRIVRSLPIYQGTDFKLDDARQYLLQFPGGNVHLNLDETSGIATICLNNTQKKNAITGKMMVDLENVINQLELWETGKGILIFGADNNFCSGGDLEFAQQSGTAEGGYKMATFMQNVLIRLQKLPMVSVAFIQGFAVGGGAELAISCDFRLFSNDDSALGFVHSKMGIIPAWGGLTIAINTLGYRTVLDLILTGRVVRAAEATRLGLCDQIVGDLSGATSWLSQRTMADCGVVRAAKVVALNSCQTSNHEDALNFEKMVFSPLWGGSANKAALKMKLKHR